MSALDWGVLVVTLALIVGVGVWRGRGVKSSDSYLRGGDLSWWTIGLSVMATQASAITFLSMPGQAFDEGMGFVQFYFGQPIAMVLLAAFVVPIYFRAKVYTAYEYLETRFDQRTRQLTALLFLVQRGLAAGISIYAPAIVLSTVLHTSLPVTNLAIGMLVIFYSVSGGTRAVSRTQTLQMAIMLSGMALAFGLVVHALPANLGMWRAFDVADALGRMKIIDLSPRPGARYTLWSGLFGGLFVGLAYFGTDQSQVQRYLSGSVRESRLGLLLNGVVKVPMQFLILAVGVMVFVFYQFHPTPTSFAPAQLAMLARSPHATEAAELERRSQNAQAEQGEALQRYLAGELDSRARLGAAGVVSDQLRRDRKALVQKAQKGASADDADYVFIRFVLAQFPVGLVGLLLAVIVCASMSATASTLNALATTTVVDFYKRSVRPDASDAQLLRVARWSTVGWGLMALLFAATASLADNLIQAVNILGSIFYGPTLGVFAIAFFGRRIGARAVFWALLVGQAIVFAVFAGITIAYLWLNVIGCAAVVSIAVLWPAPAVRTPAS